MGLGNIPVCPCVLYRDAPNGEFSAYNKHMRPRVAPDGFTAQRLLLDILERMYLSGAKSGR
jgi:hypothetical protein